MATETPDLSGFRVELIHREILRKLTYHESEIFAGERADETPSMRQTRETYNVAAHDTLRNLRGLLETCIESERRERAAYAAAGQDC